MRQIPGGFANQGQLAMLARSDLNALWDLLHRELHRWYSAGRLSVVICSNSAGISPAAFPISGPACRRFGRFLVLLVLINLMTFLWSMLFIIPGIIAGYRYSMAVYLLLDHPDLRPMEAIRLSCGAHQRLQNGPVPGWISVSGITICALSWSMRCLSGFCAAAERQLSTFGALPHQRGHFAHRLSVAAELCHRRHRRGLPFSCRRTARSQS